MDAIIIFWSKTGNTEKVAIAVQDGLKDAGTNVSMLKVEDAGRSISMTTIWYVWAFHPTNGALPSRWINF